MKLRKPIEASIGSLVEFKAKSGQKFTGKVVKVFGEVYTIETEDVTRPVHQKYLLKIVEPKPTRSALGSQA